MGGQGNPHELRQPGPVDSTIIDDFIATLGFLGNINNVFVIDDDRLECVSATRFRPDCAPVVIALEALRETPGLGRLDDGAYSLIMAGEKAE